MGEIQGVLLDIDGVLTVSWEALPGALEAIAWLRREQMPFRLITNTTTHTRRDLATTLGAAGFEVEPDQIVTAVVALATASPMRWSGLFLLAGLGGAIFPDDGGLWLTGASFSGLGLWMIRRPAHERATDEAVR